MGLNTEREGSSTMNHANSQTLQLRTFPRAKGPVPCKKQAVAEGQLTDCLTSLVHTGHPTKPHGGEEDAGLPFALCETQSRTKLQKKKFKTLFTKIPISRGINVRGYTYVHFTFYIMVIPLVITFFLFFFFSFPTYPSLIDYHTRCPRRELLQFRISSGLFA